MAQGVKRIDVFTNKFSVGQRVRNVRNGYLCTILTVDPHSFSPLPPAPGTRRQARHNPYQVRYDHLTTPYAPWIAESELEALDG